MSDKPRDPTAPRPLTEAEAAAAERAAVESGYAPLAPYVARSRARWPHHAAPADANPQADADQGGQPAKP